METEFQVPMRCAGGDAQVVGHLQTWKEFRGKDLGRVLNSLMLKKKKKNREVMGVDMIAQHAGDARKEASQGSEELLH